MAARAGMAPWSAGYTKSPFSKVKFKAKGSKHNLGDFKEIRSSATGDIFKVPAGDYKELVSYLNQMHINAEEAGNRQVNGGISASYRKAVEKGKVRIGSVHTPGDFIDFGFSSEQSRLGNIWTVECKGGHIASLSYNAYYMLLKVRFSKACNLPDTVVFFNLPADKATTLMYLAENNVMAPPDKDGTERHMVGVEFWNIVRVRGTIHETKYAFSYTDGGGSGSAPMGGGKFTQEDANKIARKNQIRRPNSNAKRPEASSRSKKDIISDYGQRELSDVLSKDGEYRDWFDEMIVRWSTSGDSYLLRAAKLADKYFEQGDIDSCKRELYKLAVSGVQFPDTKKDYAEKALEEE